MSRLAGKTMDHYPSKSQSSPTTQKTSADVSYLIPQTYVSMEPPMCLFNEQVGIQ